MGLLERIGRMIRANITNLIQEAEDPETIIEQALMDMQQDLINLRRSLAQVIATQKRTERQIAQHQELAQQWYQRAQIAVTQGAEDIARDALVRRQVYHNNAQSLGEQIAQQNEIINSLKQELRSLEAKITDAKMKKDLYLARMRSAVASQKMHELVDNLNNSGYNSIFERIESKIMALEAESELTASLSKDPLEKQFAALESFDHNNIEIELNKLRKKD